MAAIAPPTSSFSKASLCPSSTKSPNPISRFTLPYSLFHTHHSVLSTSPTLSLPKPPPPPPPPPPLPLQTQHL
ncbi:hypothetical protein M0R45_025045 [Rubus argutus]|uniref:Uncharacterized protein n=1 Tax=Rubus argutus TaxID=59490 RepID=A0AAW1WST9_RUBAR